MRPERLRFVDVQVEEHDELPDGCSMRFKAQDDGRVLPPSTSIPWESEDGPRANEKSLWRIEAASSDGSRRAAVAFAVDDSSAGTSILIVGGDHGLRLTAIDTGETIAEPYLLLSRSALDL